MSISELLNYSYDKPKSNLLVNSTLDKKNIYALNNATVLLPALFFNSVFIFVSDTVSSGFTTTLPPKNLLDEYLINLIGVIPAGYVFTSTFINNSNYTQTLDTTGYTVLDPLINSLPSGKTRTLYILCGSSTYSIIG